MKGEVMEKEKQLYVSFTDHDVLTKIRDLNATRISQLTKITGQVRTRANLLVIWEENKTASENWNQIQNQNGILTKLDQIYWIWNQNRIKNINMIRWNCRKCRKTLKFKVSWIIRYIVVYFRLFEPILFIQS